MVVDGVADVARDLGYEFSHGFRYPVGIARSAHAGRVAAAQLPFCMTLALS